LGVVALIVLAAIWAAFLLPPIFRARAENRPSGSISDFRRQLRVLARTSPARSGNAAGFAPPLFGAGPSMSYLRPPGTARGPLLSPSSPSSPSSSARGLSTSRQSIKRRRDVLAGLLVAMVGSLVLGFLPPLRALWAVHVVVDVLFAAYVGLLLYLRNLAAEREMKVRFLPGVPASAVGAGPEPALLYRRSAN
jgi:hypothetical protein